MLRAPARGPLPLRHHVWFSRTALIIRGAGACALRHQRHVRFAACLRALVAGGCCELAAALYHHITPLVLARRFVLIARRVLSHIRLIVVRNCRAWATSLLQHIERLILVRRFVLLGRLVQSERTYLVRELVLLRRLAPLVTQRRLAGCTALLILRRRAGELPVKTAARSPVRFVRLTALLRQRLPRPGCPCFASCRWSAASA